jgi:hypothetical protein
VPSRTQSASKPDKFFDLGVGNDPLFSPIVYSKNPSRAELLEHINDIISGEFEEKFVRRHHTRYLLPSMLSKLKG